MPRNHARPRLIACLALQPAHARSQRMLDELSAYGAGDHGGPELGAVSQAEIDALPTGRYPAARDPRSAAAMADALGFTPNRPHHAACAGTRGRHRSPGGRRRDERWLDDEAVTLIDEGAHPRSMVPVTDRPPPPDGSVAPPRRVDTQRTFPV